MSGGGLKKISKNMAKPRLYKLYKDQIIPKMKKIFGYKNDLAVPKIEKVVLNVGTGQALKEKKLLDIIIANIARISGQLPEVRKARKAISGFGIKKGNIVGLRVTLRGRRMYEFLDKFINAALPRVRDFRGLNPSGFDGRGNFTYGVKEQTIFPEIKSDEVEKVHGLEVTIVTTARDDKTAKEFLKLFGFPFSEKAKKEEDSLVDRKKVTIQRYEEALKLLKKEKLQEKKK